MKRVRNVTKPNAATQAAMAGVEPPRAIIFSESDVTRMYDIVENRTGKNAEHEARRSEELKKASDARVANWPNTIEASRVKKEQARKQRLDEEEARRRKIDEHESGLFESHKEQAIRRANLLLFEENDRVKTFGSKLFLASVLDERQKQIALKQEQRLLVQQMEERAALIEAEHRRAAAEKEQLLLRDIDERAIRLREVQMRQLEDIRQRKIRERDSNIAEGQLIKLRAEIALEEAREAEVARVAAQQERNRELVEANAEQKSIRAQRCAEERAHEEEIMQFAKMKEAQQSERARRLDEKESVKRSVRQEIIDRQARHLAEIKANQEEREMRMQRNFVAERDAKEATERQKRDARQKDIADFRDRQVSMVDANRAKQAAERVRMQAIWKHHAERATQEELAEQRRVRETALENQRILQLQAQEKRMQGALQRRQELEEGVAMQAAAMQEQELVEDYVNSVMHEHIARGRDSEVVLTASRRLKKTFPTKK